MTIDFDRQIDRRNSDSVKWNRFDEDVLPLWVADMDFLSPLGVQQALEDRVSQGIYGYSMVQEASKQAVCDWLLKRHAWAVDPTEIVLLPGVVPGFNLAAKITTNPGDSLVIQTPAYHPFFQVAPNTRTRQILSPLETHPNGRSYFSAAGFLDCLEPSTRLVLFCSPHNPTGRVFTEEELRALAEICLDRRIIICSDEIHSDITYSPHEHIPIASLSEEIGKNTITLISPSKTFNLAGLKAAAAVIPNAKLRKAFSGQLSANTGAVNLLGEAALKAAYTDGGSWLDELLKYLAGNREILIQFIDQELPGAKCSLPEGTYLGWLDLTDYKLEAPGKYILERGKVALNSGEWFGAAYKQFVRLNFGCPQTVLLEALERIKIALH